MLAILGSILHPFPLPPFEWWISHSLGWVLVEIMFSSPFTDRVCFITVLCLKPCWQLGCGDWGRWKSSWWSLVGFSRSPGVQSWNYYTTAYLSLIKCSISYLSRTPISFIFSCNFNEIRNFQGIQTFINFWSPTVMYDGQSMFLLLWPPSNHHTHVVKVIERDISGSHTMTEHFYHAWNKWKHLKSTENSERWKDVEAIVLGAHCLCFWCNLLNWKFIYSIYANT